MVLLKKMYIMLRSEIFKYLNKNVTSSKTKHLIVQNEFNELSKKVKAISTKGLPKDLINKFNILNEAKKISSEIFQNVLVFILAGKYLKYFKALLVLFVEIQWNVRR